MLDSSDLTRRASLGAMAALLGSALRPAAAADRPLRVVASFSILADLAAQVAGPVAEVSALVEPDADAHVFQPSPADVRRLAQADLVIVNGLGFEGWMTRLIGSAGYRGPVLTCSDGLKPRAAPVEAGQDHAGHAHAHGHGAAQGGGGAPDPHAWQDIANARHYVARIRDALVTARPAQAELLRRRAAAYDAELAALDRRIRADFATLAPQQRRVVSSHDAFGYFAAAYGLEFLAAQSWNTDSEPSAADIARLIRQIRRQQIRAVFVENVSDARMVQRIARETGAVVGGTLHSDALSAPGGVADSYLKMMSHNAATLLAGLRGPAAAPR
ncbi:metal ABC transporter substrate-binding protein [Sphaerotilus sulfidivorans]